MAFLKIENIELTGVACCVPKNTEYNKDYPLFTEKEHQIFVSGTGVEERRVAEKGICSSDLCYEAAEKLITDLTINREEIKVLIFVSQSPDYFLPATAVILQDRLNLSKSCMAFDVGLGCSGYVYGLSLAGSLLQTMHEGYALVLAGDISTSSSNVNDKTTRPLFGDAGSATLIHKKINASPLFFNLQSDGSGHESIIIRGGATRLPFHEDSRKENTIEEGITRCELNLEMDGVEVFNFTLREVKNNIVNLLEFSQKSIDEIDYCMMHQANHFLNETVRKKLKIDSSKIPYSLKKYGNTSSASIPLTMVTALKYPLENEKLRLLLSGFGVGLSWGSAYLESNSIFISELVEI
jgi:3-oxoacyl-[acyl-carrier-protein] synthase-3